MNTKGPSIHPYWLVDEKVDGRGEPCRAGSTEESWVDAFPVMRQLGTHLDEDSYLHSLRELTDDGYRLFAVSVDDTVVALAGAEIQVNMYDGRHV